MATSHLILGGARSGKSRYAVGSAPALGRVTFVATAHQAGDGDMAARVARHRAERPARWATVEAPYDLAAAVEKLGPDALDAVIVDCLTVWVGNRVLRHDTDAAVLADTDRLAAVAARPPWDLTIVTNEVGEGVHPETAAGLRFRDLLGIVNQRLAAACDRVTLMVAGLPVAVKAPAPAPPHDFGPQTA
ncbi:MAG: bifunctional adenosylcobinamide kinase/adenosylcobinamide-phosphate guanylyltransferase [Candidatus Rokuibacteriota bacterium]